MIGSNLSEWASISKRSNIGIIIRKICDAFQTHTKHFNANNETLNTNYLLNDSGYFGCIFVHLWIFSSQDIFHNDIPMTCKVKYYLYKVTIWLSWIGCTFLCIYIYVHPQCSREIGQILRWYVVDMCRRLYNYSCISNSSDLIRWIWDFRSLRLGKSFNLRANCAQNWKVQ